MITVVMLLMWGWLVILLSLGLIFGIALTILSILFSAGLSLMLPELSFNPYRITD
jgi:hypothetical protein